MTQEQNLIRLMQEHQRDVWRYLRYIGAEAALADDITQETFIELFHNPINELSRSATAGWLRKVAKHRYLNALRKMKREVPADWLEEAESVWSDLTPETSDDRLDALERCLNKLSERARQAIELKYTQARKETEVAEALETTAEAAKALLKRTREQLRECIERQVKA
ncbi:MAG: RNA polymerase sigma factor [Planctomycetes bacterium]|nr:RNA polymerase sigma factor [Planctomycetota bacterium]